MADPANQKGAVPSDCPPPPYTPMMASSGMSYMPMQVPPSVIHPNVKISSNVRINDPSSVKINGMPLTTAYPQSQMVGMTTFGGPGFQQTTAFVPGAGFHTMQSMQSSGPGQMQQQSVVIPGTGIVISQNNYGAGPTGHAAGSTGSHPF